MPVAPPVIRTVLPASFKILQFQNAIEHSINSVPKVGMGALVASHKSSVKVIEYSVRRASEFVAVGSYLKITFQWRLSFIVGL
jgi:hypothetical protein